MSLFTSDSSMLIGDVSLFDSANIKSSSPEDIKQRTAAETHKSIPTVLRESLLGLWWVIVCSDTVTERGIRS